MKTIYKYGIKPNGTELDLPRGAEVLTVQTQHNEPHIWVLLDTAVEEKEKRNFHYFGTGHPIHYDYLKYVGTFQLENGYLVFHLFEEIK